MLVKNKNFWEELITCFPLNLQGPHKKPRVQQLFYCCMCIYFRGNIFTEPFPSKG
jgi:hypothetical protein